MALIVALIHGRSGNYGISFPDFPGCVAGGDTIEQAVARGRDALSTHIATMIAEEMPVPPIRTVDAIRSDPDFAGDFDDAVAVGVDFEMPGRSVRVNLSFEEGLLKRIDRAARAAGKTRSGFLAEAARKRLRG
jgi:predicted RNase H-like HicB family nuclease